MEVFSTSASSYYFGSHAPQYTTQQQSPLARCESVHLGVAISHEPGRTMTFSHGCLCRL
jgi:hypothetical protein